MRLASFFDIFFWFYSRESFVCLGGELLPVLSDSDDEDTSESDVVLDGQPAKINAAAIMKMYFICLIL